MHDVTSWSRDLTVETRGRDVINHAGAAALRLIADRSGLTAGLSGALARRGFTPVHGRGRVLADTAVLIADGGRVLSDLATLRGQGELFGPMASDPTGLPHPPGHSDYPGHHDGRRVARMSSARP